MNLPDPPEEYSAQYLSQLNEEIRELDDFSVKINKDNYLQQGGLILLDTAVANRYYKLTVTSGTLGVTEVTDDPYA
jgi:hypothetical protein